MQGETHFCATGRHRLQHQSLADRRAHRVGFRFSAAHRQQGVAFAHGACDHAHQLVLRARWGWRAGGRHRLSAQSAGQLYGIGSIPRPFDRRSLQASLSDTLGT